MWVCWFHNCIQVRNTQKNYLRLMDDRDEFYALHKFTLDYPGNLGLLTSPDLLVSVLIQYNSRVH